MAIKIDLEKAYDRLNWVFIHDTLKDVGLPNRVIELIMECMTTASMSYFRMGVYRIPLSLLEGFVKEIRYTPISLSFV